LLAAAIAAEVVATLALRSAEGFTRPLASVVVVVGYGIATVLLSIVIRSMPLSVTYAIWAGAGTAIIAAIGMTFLREPAGPLRIASVVVIVAGIVGLNLTSAGH
jgi:small multidrug resistance pump